MPPRIARSSVQLAAPKNAKNKNRKRNLDAYAIASHSAPEKARIKQSRLGELLDEGPRQKKRRVVENYDDEVSAEENVPMRKRRTLEDDGIEEGSDSSGNEWTLGGLAEDDEDSELDSDEAFGASDEERFEGFNFRGSSSGKEKISAKKSRTHVREDGDDDGIDLDEGDSGAEEDEDEFGDEGVDLATMLDDEDEEVLGGKDTTGKDMGEDSASDDEDATSGSDSEVEEDDEDNGADEERVARMRDRLEAMDGVQQNSKSQSAPQMTTLSVEDLLADLDPASRKQFSAPLKTKRKSDRPTTLAAPLPKMKQDKINREVASSKAKEQLDRWRDTVVHNRRAEFLSFPLKDPNRSEPLGKDKFTDAALPQSELEESIQRIMEESGLAAKASSGAADDGEDSIMKSEELATNKIPVEEVLRRQAELRRHRELLFREEIKAKRIAKIKSKSYRRVHRKEKERTAQREQEERERFGLGGMDEDDKERADKRRAEERMGTKHKNSKWARALKETDRGVWDENAREGVLEQARRQEELRRRIAGHEVSDQESDVSSDENDATEDEVAGDAWTKTKLDRLEKDDDQRDGKGLADMKFMRAARARQEARNQEDVERLRKELAVADGDEEDENDVEDQSLGRAIFGPKSSETKVAVKSKRPELEEGEASEDEDQAGEDGQDDGVQIVTERPRTKQAKGVLKNAMKASGPLAKGLNADGKGSEAFSGLSWTTAPVTKSKKDRQREREANYGTLIDTKFEPRPSVNTSTKGGKRDVASETQSTYATNAANTNGWTQVHYKSDSDASDGEQSNPILTPQQQRAELHRRAFAGDDVHLAFEAEKAELAESEDEKEVSNHLPGWGSWTGEGLSKAIRKSNAKQKHNPLFKTKVLGVRPADRRDAKLKNVIISEKTERKGKKYLAPILPHEFERKEQYERSLRVPVGPEWTTKETFQRETRPRVVVRPGTVVEAMERPTV